MTLYCRDCKKKFPIAARKSIEKVPDLGERRVIVDYPCCPFCESLNIEECNK